ncbi:MAG: cell division protein FtsZ [Bacteroidetes bacterium]|nr:cell division protein FtsZ [Bacteroidota bacterium]
MPLNNFTPDIPTLIPSIIKVIGVGGGGSNAVNYMYKAGIEGVQFYVCNTDAQALRSSVVPNKIQLGVQLTEGLGAGSEPEMGQKAAQESADKIAEMLRQNTKMVFITAGMGGGTGTGAAPVIAEIARQMGILTVGIVTVPFSDEGPDRRRQAEEGIEKLRPHVDALLVIINDRVLEMYENLPISKAFASADNVLCTAAKGIAEIITRTGYINVDFRDVETAMRNSGRAVMGMGQGAGEDRAEIAVKSALDSPLLNNMRLDGARHILVNIVFGNTEPTMKEIRKITGFLQDKTGNTAKLKFGLTNNPELNEELSVTVIATSFQDSFSVNTALEPESEQEELIHLPIDIEALEEEPSPVPHVPTFQPVGKYTPPPRPEIYQPVITNDDLNTPAYLRMGIKLETVPESDKQLMSKMVMVEEEGTKTPVLKKNTYYSNNPD